MNKQELIERIEGLKNIFWNECEYVKIDFMIELVSELDEPQKVTIPRFVADWIDNMKGQGKTLYYGLDHTPPEEVDLWFCEDEVNRQNTFARAWLDGYEVEQEKRYRVKMKGIDKTSYLNHDILKKTWFFSIEHDGFTVRTHHTRKELEEAGFSEVFNSPLFEVEEVQDDSKI